MSKTYHKTITVESMIGTCGHHSANVKRWRDGTMALRWRAAGAARSRSSVPSCQCHLHLPRLRARDRSGRTVGSA